MGKFDILSQCERFLSNHGIPTDYLDKVLDEMLEQKSKLNNVLGLNEENDFRIIIPLKVSSKALLNEHNELRDYVFSYFFSFITDKERFTGIECDLVDNTINYQDINGKKFTMKLTKFINRYYSEEFLNYLKNNVYSPGLQGLDNTYKILHKEDFLTKLGEIRANAQGKKQLVLSTNLYDFLTSSTDSAYTSCYSIKGCHFNGNLAYARDSFTMIAFITNKEDIHYKIGRSWLYINLYEGGPCIIQPKSYGTFEKMERKQAREHLEKLISDYFQIDNSSWRVREEKCWDAGYIFNPGAVYFDYYNVDLAYLAGSKYQNNLPYLSFMEAFCLQCGNTTCYGEGGTCDYCSDSTSCCNCGDWVNHNNTYYNDDGEAYCESCFYELYTYCEHCESTILQEDATYINDYAYCPRCRDRYFTECHDCGKYHKSDEVVFVDSEDYYICEDCYQDDYFTCDICSEVYHRDNIKQSPAGDYYCEDCYNEEFSEEEEEEPEEVSSF